jgi:hypothetical protein
MRAYGERYSAIGTGILRPHAAVELEQGAAVVAVLDVF